MVRGGWVPAGLVSLLLVVAGTEAPAQEEAVVIQVRIGRVGDRQAVERAAEGVRQRLRDPECRRVLADFNDPQGRSLADALDALGRSAEEYLGWVYFYDGFGMGRCMQKSVYAISSPGSRVVRMCGPRFTELEGREPRTAQAVVLHEVLHTLGLGENPPNSAHITQRVVERCYPEMVTSPFGKGRPRGPTTAMN